MKERPILFNSEMVRAILEGRKTQTRRVVKQKRGWHTTIEDGKFLCEDKYGDWHEWKGPYGQPGNRLWVRESHRKSFCLKHDEDMPLQTCACKWFYRASDPDEAYRWTPSIHMPRAVSRIDLEITGVRIERLHDISEEDAEAEGAEKMHLDDLGQTWKTYRRGFQSLWESINGEDSWNENPWVWVIEFKRIFNER